MSIAFVQANGASGGPGTVQQAVFATNVVAGNTLVAMVDWQDITTITVAVSDNVNGAWTAVGTPTTNSNGFRSQAFSKANAAAGATTVTATASASVGFMLIDALEYSGADTTTPIDASNGGTGTSSVPSLSITTVTNLAAVVAHTIVSGSATSGAGFNGRLNTASNPTEDKLGVTPAGAVTALFATSNTWWTVIAVALKPTSTGGATVSAVPALSLGDVPAPTVSAGSTVTAAVALSLGAVPAPTVTATGDATVTAVPALSLGDVPAPTIAAGATVTAVPALSLGSAPPVNNIISSVVNAPAAVAAGTVPVPAVSGVGDATVTAVPAISLGDVPAPVVRADWLVAAVPAISAGAAPPPTIAAGSTVTAAPALSVGQVPRPAVSPAPAGGSQVISLAALFAEDSV